MLNQFIKKVVSNGRRNLYGFSFLLMAVSLLTGMMVTTEAVIAPASYVIYIDGSTYYAQNGQTGINDYSGSDAKTVIESAITALTNGGKVFIKGGTYTITSPINVLKSNITVEGEGERTQLDATTLNRGGYQTRGVFENGNYFSGQTNVTSITGFTLRSLLIRGTYTITPDGVSGIILAKGSVGDTYNILIENVKFDNCYCATIFYGVTKIVAMKNQVNGGLAGPTVNTAADNTPCRYVTFNENQIFNANDDGLAFLGHGLRDCVAIGNVIDKNGGIAGSGIKVTSNDTSPYMSRISIIGNVITNCTAQGGIIVETGNPNEKDIVVSGNVLDNCDIGIQISANAVVKDNIITNSELMGIRNLMKNGLTGVSRSIIGNNIIDSVSSPTGSGIVIQGQYNEVFGNIIRNCPTGIEENNGNLTNPDYNYYHHNETLDLVTTKMTILGANNIIKANRGYVTENSGTATISNSATSVAVNHGLSYTPSLNDIHVTPTNNLGNSTKFWVSSPTSSQFTTNVSPAPGSGKTATFSWQIIRN